MHDIYSSRCTRPRQEVPGNKGGPFCMGAQIIAGVLPYKNLIPVSEYFLPGTSKISEYRRYGIAVVFTILIRWPVER